MIAITERDLAALCARAFPDRTWQQIADLTHIPSRQHEIVSFHLSWHDDGGPHDEELLARRYVSTLSWWRPDDLGKAQRETSVIRWLFEQGFPVPEVYAREFGALGDVALFARLPGEDWSESGASFPET